MFYKKAVLRNITTFTVIAIFNFRWLPLQGSEFGNKNSFAKKSERSEEKSPPQAKQEVEELQAFAFSIVTVNAEHTKPRFKRKLRG